MNIGASVSICFSKYATFQGRASRSEYWFFALATFLAAIAAVILDSVMFGSPFGLFYVALLLVTFLPYLSVFVRRLHDTDRSGWWYWILLVPIVGGILIIIWLCTKGTDGSNRWGDDPLSDGF